MLIKPQVFANIYQPCLRIWYYFRLGMQVGDKVMDNGQDKADLSDPFRPTRIGQDFSDLFDNEWSDAFEEMAFKDDDCKVRFLLLIMEVSLMCFLKV